MQLRFRGKKEISLNLTPGIIQIIQQLKWWLCTALLKKPWTVYSLKKKLLERVMASQSILPSNHLNVHHCTAEVLKKSIQGHRTQCACPAMENTFLLWQWYKRKMCYDIIQCSMRSHFSPNALFFISMFINICSLSRSFCPSTMWECPMEHLEVRALFKGPTVIWLLCWTWAQTSNTLS